MKLIVAIVRPERANEVLEALFRAGIRQLGLKPAECLYVGDLYPVDVLGARGAGMEALLVDPSGKVDRPVDRVLSVRHVPEYLAGPPGSPGAGR
jgi:FMN phosphatase YigB (HAD superfamily)